MLKGKFLTLNYYITNRNPKINDLRFFFFKMLEAEVPGETKVSRAKKIINIRGTIKKTDTLRKKVTMPKILLFFISSNNVDKPLARLIEIKKKQHINH